MFADANILIRYIINDDEIMAAKADEAVNSGSLFVLPEAATFENQDGFCLHLAAVIFFCFRSAFPTREVQFFMLKDSLKVCTGIAVLFYFKLSLMKSVDAFAFFLVAKS